MNAWEAEQVPDSDALYYRVHIHRARRGRLAPAIFHEQDGSMSMDWSKYSTPSDTLSRARKPPENGVVTLRVQSVREIGLAVVHSPDVVRRNRAHTDVNGLAENKTEFRVRLYSSLVDGGRPPHDRWTIRPVTAE
jgi:hypothetical protein